MFNPTLAELVAREQNNDRLREADQIRLAELASTHQPADRFNLRAYLGNRLIAMGHTLKALARADEMSAGRHRP